MPSKAAQLAASSHAPSSDNKNLHFDKDAPLENEPNHGQFEISSTNEIPDTKTLTTAEVIVVFDPGGGIRLNDSHIATMHNG